MPPWLVYLPLQLVTPAQEVEHEGGVCFLRSTHVQGSKRGTAGKGVRSGSVRPLDR